MARPELQPLAATVLTADHDVLDVLVGVAFGLAGSSAALWLERRRGARATAPLPYVSLTEQGVPTDEDCEQRRR